MSLVVDEHREYLSDGVRLSAFRRALSHYVTPQSVVADIGTGTGILALLACRAGAARVYGIEASGMVEIARALAAANGVGDRLHVVKGHASEVALPEPVDVIVGDFIGRFGFESGIFETYPAAVRSFLKPGGAIIPSELSLFIAPVESAEMDRRVRFWETPRAGVDVAPALEWAINTGYPAAFDASHLLGDAVEIARAPTGVVPSRGFSADVRMTIRRDGVLHWLAGGFTAQLAPGVTLTNAPGAAERAAKRNVFFPVRTPVAVRAGDLVHVQFGIRPNELIVSWTVDVCGSNGARRARSSQSTFGGMLVSREDLHRAKPDFIPVLTPRGRARLSVLQLCNGVRPLQEVERLVYERHRELFASPGEAEAFVADVTAGYARP